ncbi:MAG TPA: class II D-tagatose-bisphosphate aldolase, non-catalytic subunit [Anaerolineae bacterium]|nr:class II D-tagatose-bisphosphate aldolase, non-catalytic subunit [Anaerolineae bacterium]
MIEWLSGMGAEHCSHLEQIVAAQKRGVPLGIASICSANGHVLGASAHFAACCGGVLLVESTCNQVNQYGGYTGLTPAQFRSYAGRIAERACLPMEQVILGGDHLGPSPWKGEPVDRAMARARQLVGDCVTAGYRKIHLDASMHLAGDKPQRPLPREVSAARTAELCEAAEEAWKAQGERASRLCYVIGSEVPLPGGAAAADGELVVTPVAAVQETLDLTRQAFLARGLQGAWERVIALVVQPGVEFGSESVHKYRPAAAAELARFIRANGRLVYEVHSTDYQTGEALRQLVRDQFAILKVGPALTFALRQALFALAMMEEEWLGGDSSIERSDLVAQVEREMLERPEHWQAYYQGSEAQVRLARRHSFSDRVRYYWSSPVLEAAAGRLIGNLEAHPLPYTLLSQYLPAQYARVRTGELTNRPRDLIRDKITDVLKEYHMATRGERSQGHEPG